MLVPDQSVFRVVAPTDWDDTVRFARNHLNDCMFRGQSRTSYPLSTSLERIANQNKIDPVHVAAIEREMLMQFRRRIHQYIPQPPPPSSRLEWLALMQHYGAPTRLLDFTRSFYVAAFFALERADGDAAIWAVNYRDLDLQVNKKLGTPAYKTLVERAQRYARIAGEFLNGRSQFLDGTVDGALVFDVEPERMNERLSAQQGVFLFPTNLRMDFESNLAATFGITAERLRSDDLAKASNQTNESDDSRASIVKIVLADSWRQNALADLVRMNITAATLFPGLEGYARSLATEVQLWRHRRPDLVPESPTQIQP